MGLRIRIVIALAVVMVLFIILTELSVSQLVRIAMSRQIVAAHTIEGREMLDESLEQDLWNLRKLIFFYMVVGATIAIVLGSWTVTRLVVRPLSRITKAVEQVSEGRLETEVPIAGAGELVRLGVAFNRMTTTLREQQGELRSQLDELKKSSAELKEVQDRLIRAAKLASVGTLAAGVAHEIGNPLAGVLGLLGALDEEEDEEKAKDYRALMRKEIERIDRIINDLVAYARPARSETTAGASSNVEDVFKHVQALLGAQKLFDGINVETSFTGGPWTVAVSRDDLTQILINLLLNAAQAMNGQGTIAVQ
ncbi:MAG: HAMP domain-containing protein, partial [Deltaproteobacteria bacterium]|nr:HAMP domain-containing protein [Deltaproteobacteria bacterium]